MRIVISLKTIFNIFNVMIVLLLAFIFLGDKVLPKQLGTMSEKIRTNLHQAIAKFISEEQQEFRGLKGNDGSQKSKLKLHKPGTYFDRAVDQVEKQTNATNSNNSK